MVRRQSVLLLAIALLAVACRGGKPSPPLPTLENLKLPPCTGNVPSIRGVQTVQDNPPRTVYLNDYVIVVLCGMQEFVGEARRQDKPITLYIDYLDAGIEPMGIDPATGAIAFVFDRNEQNTDLLRDRLYDPIFESRQELRLSVARKGEPPLQLAPNASNAVILDKIYVDKWRISGTSLFVVLLIGLLWYGGRHGVLRQGPRVGDVPQPYSLPRVQMAFWFVLIVMSFFFVWSITGDRDTLPQSVLGLMGISAATAVAAVAINPPKREGEIPPSQGFVRDLLTNDQGVVSLDRVQIVVWTLVLAYIFLESVVWQLTMPEFSATLLTLMGISSGTYLGFQFPQKKE